MLCLPARRYQEVSGLPVVEIRERSAHANLPSTMLEDLLVSDLDYFCAAARSERLPCCTLYRMPGLESLAAGCVVHDIDVGLAAQDSNWLHKIETYLRNCGYKHARFYQQQRAPNLIKQFLEGDYRRVHEVALIAEVETKRQSSDMLDIELRPVVTDEDWAKKLELHHDVAEDPDGHSSQAEKWVDMERQKCAAGYMAAFFICANNDICGTVNLSLTTRIARLKYLVVHPLWRRKGIGICAAAQFVHLAKIHGRPAAGCFALSNVAALQMYKRAGYIPIGEQIEWFKVLQ